MGNLQKTSSWNCVRWFVTFDGKECSNVPIDGIVFWKYESGEKTKDLSPPGVIRGNCLVKKSGSIDIELQVQGCSTNYNAYTGFRSSTRIYVEEVGAPQ